MVTIPAYPVNLSATLVGLQVVPVYDSNANIRNIRVVALVAGTPNPVPAPQWAQLNRRVPNSAEMAAILAVPMNPGEAVVPTWIERASAAFLGAVYGDIVTPASTPKTEPDKK